MISIFNGRSRSLGETSKREVHLQLSVTFRRYLHHFKGAQLSVFLSIALHMDEKGWSWPRVSTIRKETGYDDNAVYKALNKLCQLKVKGHRVLLRAKEAPAHYVPEPKDKNYTRNFYLLFPSPDEIVRLEAEDGDGGDNSNRIPKTVSTKRDSLFVDTEKVDTVLGIRSLNTKEEPSIKKNHKAEADPHPQAEPTAPPPPAPMLFDETRPARTNGGGGSRFTLTQNIKFARHRASQGAKIDPEAVGRARFKDGVDDELIEEYRKRTPEQIAAERAAPTTPNLFYGEVLTKVRSMVEAGADPLQVIREMALDDDMRWRLEEKFAGSQPSQETDSALAGSHF